MFKLLNHGSSPYPPHGIFGPAEWACYDLILVTQGSATITVKKRPFECFQGDSLLIPPHHHFLGKVGEHGCTIWVQHFSPTQSGHIPAIKLPLKPTLWKGSARSEWARALTYQLEASQASGIAHTSSTHLPIILNLLLDTLYIQHRSLALSSTSNIKVETLIEMILKHPHPLPQVESLAQKLQISTSHLRSLFRQQTKQSLGIFLRNRRMHEAERLLRGTTTPIKEISRHVGYSHVIAFHRTFLKTFGITPAKFRTQQARATV